jgi:hypothetical protein
MAVGGIAAGSSTAPYAGGVTESEVQPDITAKPSPYLQLAIGLLVFFAASFAALLAAGTLGVGGVVIAALIEVAAITWIYRWCEA